MTILDQKIIEQKNIIKNFDNIDNMFTIYDSVQWVIEKIECLNITFDYYDDKVENTRYYFVMIPLKGQVAIRTPSDNSIKGLNRQLDFPNIKSDFAFYLFVKKIKLAKINSDTKMIEDWSVGYYQNYNNCKLKEIYDLKLQKKVGICSELLYSLEKVRILLDNNFIISEHEKEVKN